MEFGDIRETLASIGVFPDRRLGQTFLVDEAVAVREADAAGIVDTDTILEIGPGLGMLTYQLCSRAERVIAVEKDRRLARHLRASLDAGNLEVVEGDILEIELPDYDIAAGNLPYSVASQVIFHLTGKGMAKGIFMLQKEVAERAVARPFTSEYSRMSASLQRLNSVDYCFEVGHSHFYPQPDVDSAVILLRRREGAAAWPEFDAVITMLFSQRRKTINATLRKSLSGYAAAGEKAPFAARRIEELTVAQMEELVTWLSDRKLMPAARN